MCWHQTQCHGLGMWIFGCFLLRTMVTEGREAEMRAKDSRIEDLNNDLSTLIRTMQTLKMHNELLEHRLWKVESTCVRKSESVHQRQLTNTKFHRSHSSLSV